MDESNVIFYGERYYTHKFLRQILLGAYDHDRNIFLDRPLDNDFLFLNILRGWPCNVFSLCILRNSIFAFFYSIQIVVRTLDKFLLRKRLFFRSLLNCNLENNICGICLSIVLAFLQKTIRGKRGILFHSLSFSLFWSIRRLISSETEIPRRLASLASHLSWGSAKNMDMRFMAHYRHT